MEEWRDVVGFEGLYQVSNLGRVKRLKGYGCIEERIRKTRYDRYGYLYIGLNKNGKQKYCRVHRLVAQAFIPNPENKPYIDHINGNTLDNRTENLRWVNQHENMNNPITKKRMIGKKQSENTKIKIGENVRKRTVICVETGIIYKSIAYAARINKCQRTNIWSACNGVCQTAGGYHWEYVEN